MLTWCGLLSSEQLLEPSDDQSHFRTLTHEQRLLSWQEDIGNVVQVVLDVLVAAAFRDRLCLLATTGDGGRSHP